MTNKENIKYPSLLIITRRNVLTDNDSTSVTIRSFLGSWTKDSLSLICCEDFNAGKNGRVSDNCYKLTNDNVMFGSFLFKSNNRKASSAVGNSVNTDIKNGILKRIKFWIRHSAYLIYTSLPYKKTKDLDLFIKERNPDIIYSNFTNFRMLRLVNSVSEHYGLPVVPHFFDDWPNIYFDKGTIGSHLFQRALRKLLHKSSLTLCISPKMCKEYKHRYHIEKTYPLLNSVEQHTLRRTSVNESKEFVLLFAGSLYLGRHDTLLTLCKCIRDKKTNIRLQICAPIMQWKQFENLFQAYEFVEYCGFVSSQELLAKIEGATCLLFVESLESEYLKYTSLSLSTRVPEYLSTGVPILAIGNKRQGSLEYLAENNAAYIAYTKDELVSCLDKCIKHVNDSVVLESAKQLFVNNHLQKNQQMRFFDFIQLALQCKQEHRKNEI